MSQWPVGTSLVTRGTHLGTVSPARGGPAAKVEKTENAGFGEAPALAVAQGASQGRRCGKTRLTSPPARREPGRKAPTAPEDAREHLRGGALLRGPRAGPGSGATSTGSGSVRLGSVTPRSGVHSTRVPRPSAAPCGSLKRGAEREAWKREARTRETAPCALRTRAHSRWGQAWGGGLVPLRGGVIEKGSKGLSGTLGSFCFLVWGWCLGCLRRENSLGCEPRGSALV